MQAHHIRELGVIDDILSMRSRMWCRWHVTDKPPQNETRQGDTMGIHPPKPGPKKHSPAIGGGRRGSRGGYKSACAQQAGTCMHKTHIKCLSTVILPPTNALVVRGTMPCRTPDDIHVSLFALVSAVPLIVISDKWITSIGYVS